ncbi:MAG: toxin-antitoxin system YwqK family antitoxin [Bacteroidales bacterium]|jgi:antitoxin component YwqK of YwqJK toxin-antitoxin module|nr:toxin-antitoxin system YwqK family antitoxin [Bacteroidales bacterium]
MKYCFGNMALCLPVCLLFLPDALSQTHTKVDPDGYNTFYYPNGKVASEGMMRNGQPEGYWKTYYVTGLMKSEGNRINTLLDSTWVFYTETGDTLEIIHYRLGKKSGYYHQYETTTQRNSVSRRYLKAKELFLDDRREGPSYYYYPSGKLRQVISYKNGRKQGASKEFDENGTVITLYEYHNDYMISREFVNRVNDRGEKNGTWKTFYTDGKLKDEEIYKNGVLDGTSKMYSGQGNLINERSYREGRIIEEGVQLKAEAMELISYYDDGVTLKRKGVYLDSIPIGYHYFYNQEGKPERAIRYSEKGVRTAEGPVNENEKRTGDWKTYFETGELRSEGQYTNDRQNGEWNFFFQNGKKEQIGNFRNGVLEGKWTWYFPSGNILREETYVKGASGGPCVQYSDSATVIAKGEYVEGEREGPWIESVGASREEGSYIMGAKNGMWKTYYNDGQLHHSGNFVQGYPDGRHVFYYPDGTLKEEQYYVMGRRDRNWKKYYENGALFLTVTYKNDDEIRINGIRIEDMRRE